MKFETREALYEYIKSNPEGYSAVLRSAEHRGLYVAVKEKYSEFNVRMSESYWLYCHGYEAPKKCDCGASLRFINVLSGYIKRCSKCHTEYRQYHSDYETKKRFQTGKPIPKCANTNCNNPVEIRGNGLWGTYCSSKCCGFFNSLSSREKASETMMTRYGVRNALESRDIYDKMVDGIKDKYGVTNTIHIPGVKEKMVKTNVDRYGVPYVISSKAVRAQCLQTLSEKYGEHVFNISQIPGVQQKKLESGFKAKPYTLPSGHIINVQGYEDKFLDIALSHLNEDQIEHDVDSVLYRRSDRNHHYFPDFKIHDGTYIEVKSIYTFFANYEINMLKAQGIIDHGSVLVFFIYQENVNVVSWIIKSDWVDQYKRNLGMQYEEHVCMGDHIVDMVIPDRGVVIAFRPSQFASDEHYESLRKEVESRGYSLEIVNHA